MSRKWARMVERNSDKINTRRRKEGKPEISAGGEAVERYLGRRWMFPAFLIIFAIFFAISFYGVYTGSSYWFVVISYLALGLISFYTRRPFIGIARNALLTRRFSGDRKAELGEIEEIRLSPGSAIVVLNKGRWVFSRLLNLYDTERIAAALTAFANTHGIPVVRESASRKK